MKPRRHVFRAPAIFGTPLKYGAPVFIGFTVIISGLDARAGDILRGGNAGSNKPGRAAAAGAPTPAATDAARANARDTLARTNRTMASIRAMQKAARKAARASGKNNLGKNPLVPTVDLPDVPNGLGVGGLQVSAAVALDPTKWTGANLPTQKVSKKGATKVTIKQTGQQALLEWESFNVGRKTTVTFDQSKGGEDVGKWIAFNKISDPTGNPTQILGNIKADGQIYLINRNGIIFGGGSQVNARGLTASSLPINDNLINGGLLNNPDAQFLFSGLAIPAGTNGTPAFTPEAALDPSGKYGDVTVQEGAVLKSPTNAAKTGGRVLLVGPNVDNRGSIETPDGQAILAAGLQIGFDGHASSDPSLRGLDVFVGAVEDPLAGAYAGNANQGGIIEAARGNITLAGRSVTQAGALVSTTSVSFNGRVDIQANYNAVSNRATSNASGDLFLFKSIGAIELGENSVISILPEYDSKETAIGSELALRSQVNLTGKTIRLGVDSEIFAPNASVSLASGTWYFLESFSSPSSAFVASGGQVYFESGAGIDVSGSTGISAPISQNIVEVDLRGAELANSPLQREGSLRGKTVRVDIRDAGIYQGDAWVGTPLANVTGFANLIQRSVGQLTVAGGNVDITSGGAVVMNKGSTIDVSGGSTHFEAGMVNTTRLVTFDGRLVDISQATPDVDYRGIFDGTFTEQNVKFGITKIYQGSILPDGNRFEAGSIQGAAGGTLSISASSMALDGRLRGRTTIGEKQRLSPPSASSLAIAFQSQDTSYPDLPIRSPFAPIVTFAATTRQAAVGPFSLDVNGDPAGLPEARTSLVVLSPELMDSGGFGKLTIDNHDGDIIVPEGVGLIAPTGGSISFKASNITVDGSVIARSGNISFRTFGISYDEANLIQFLPPASTPPVVAAGRGTFTLGSGGRIDASGMFVDDRESQGGTSVLPVSLGGGTVTIEGYSANLAAGGVVDVSGGALISGLGAVTYGNGGTLSISAGRELGFSSTLGGTLVLDSKLRGLSGARAAALNVTGSAIQIGGSSDFAGVTVIDPENFAANGFATISLSGIGIPASAGSESVPGLLVAADASVKPVVASLVAGVNSRDVFTGSRILRQESLRTPVKLSLSSGGASFNGAPLVVGQVVTEAGSTIVTDAGGSVYIKGQVVTLRGSIISPGGSITVNGATSFPTGGTELNALATVHLASTASLSTAGVRVLVDDPFGHRTGRVYSGGTISVNGNIIAESGAILDVSGTRGVLDLPAGCRSLDPSTIGGFSGRNYVPVAIETDGGSISLEGSEILFTDATLVGRAGGESATGGLINVKSGRFVPRGDAYNTAQGNLLVSQDGVALASTNPDPGVGTLVLDSEGGIALQQGYFSISSFSSGGFDSLNLGGNVSITGDVSIRLPGRLGIADGGVLAASGKVSLSAGQIVLGQKFRSPTLQSDVQLFTSGVSGSLNISNYRFAPTYGTGSLKIEGGLIDVGDLSLSGIGLANINARGGDVRGNGTFQMAGDLKIRAGQVYTPTERAFNVFVYDHADGGSNRLGSVTFKRGETRSLPLSAGGTLGVVASVIDQGGTLRAPLGQINLGWDGSGDAPLNPIAGDSITAPVTSLLTLRSRSTTSVSAIDPTTGAGVSIPYGITFDGKTWIDPAGNDITTAGLPEKKINLAATELLTEENSKVDLRGGGDFYAYRWVPGNGGLKDILASDTSFAIIPGYGFDYSPYAPFNVDSSVTKLGGEAGYVNGTLSAGDKITLAGGKGFPAGTYTLLPARYALFEGAYLVTPVAGQTVNFTKTAEGSSLVSGYLSNDLDPQRDGRSIISRFEVASAKIVRQRAEYQDFLANTVLRQAALDNSLSIPRLAQDSGYLSFTASSRMNLLGAVNSSPDEGGRGSLIDINSSSDILVNRTGTGGDEGQLVLKNSQLNAFGAESLLIGGIRTSVEGGVSVSTNTGSLILDNAGASLRGDDVILVSNGNLELKEGASIKSGADAGKLFDTLLFGDIEIPGSGDGTLVRVGGNATAAIVRTGTAVSAVPSLSLAPKVRISGGSIILDSTAAASLATNTVLLADDVSLGAGRIGILLKKPGTPGAEAGLLLSGKALSSLQKSAKRLALSSYSSLDTYGHGSIGNPDFDQISIHAADIAGFNSGGRTVSFAAKTIEISNTLAATSSVVPGSLDGNINFKAGQIILGENTTGIGGFARVNLKSAGSIITSGTGGLTTQGDLLLSSAVLTGESASNYSITSGGALTITKPADSASMLPAGLGSKLVLQGAGVTVNGDISLASGRLELLATTGDLVLGNQSSTVINLGGAGISFGDTVRYTGGGSAILGSSLGSVSIDRKTLISVSAPKGGGDAGAITIKTPEGGFDLKGTIEGSAGKSAAKGSFAMDIASVSGGNLASLAAILNAGDFTESRIYRIRSGDVRIDGPVVSRNYRISVDQGDLVIANTIDASGDTGGSITLAASGDLVLRDGARLDASAMKFNSAGKGGSITLEAGSPINGVIDPDAVLDLRSGSVIDLSVATLTGESASLGQFSGKLHLRAPRDASGTDVQVAAIGSSIRGASSILLEGVKFYQLSGTGTITTGIQNSIRNDSNSFLGTAGTTTAGYSAMFDRLTSLRPGLDLVLAPGAEIYNPAGDIVLGSPNSAASSDWNLEKLRFGPLSAPGVLTLRAAGDLKFYNALSDGFAAVASNAANGSSALWLAPLMARNALLPANTQSWSYRFTSGADLSSADFRAVLPESGLASDKGSFFLGKNYGNAATYGSGANQTTLRSIAGRYQVIRTGSGDISISSAKDTLILNPFASIYTAGTVVSDPTSVVDANDFVVPILIDPTGRHPNQGALGAVQQNYLPQYSMAGGEVSIAAVGNIARMTRNSNSANGGDLIDDSSRQLPNNWLYRRGYVDPVTGEFGVAGVDEGSINITDSSASTTWWVDFSNFFEGVGALGGGNVSLVAGSDVRNVDALAPTNARYAGGIPSESRKVELGGGDVVVRAGRDISGGVYYVERGNGLVSAGNEITTNSTRSPSRGIIESFNNPSIYESNTWLPTTFFIGKGGFDVQAAGSLLLGPSANPFLLPQGINNKFWYKSYFNTFGKHSYLNATSLGGEVTLRTAVTLPFQTGEQPILSAWLFTQDSLTLSNSPASFQPWLRLAETEINPFQALAGIMAPALGLYSLAGGIDLTGDLTLFPSSNGQLEILARQSIIGLQSSGISNSTGVENWLASTINVSDTNPGSIPAASRPYSYLQLVGRAASAQRVTGTGDGAGFLDTINVSFSETGSTDGVLQDEQRRHTSGNLHRGDSEPVRIYSLEGNIENLTLYSPKSARVIAGVDIGDVSLYLQNLSRSDVSLVSAGRDLSPYNANTGARIIANESISSNPLVVLRSLAGDIQIGGPGTLEVLAGRNLDLGIGGANPDGTGTGITSIGNGRNPFLPFKGADLVTGVGIGQANGLDLGNMDFDSFITDFVDTKRGRKYLKEIAPGTDFDTLSGEGQDQLALEVFYRILRDTGRNYNDSESPGYRKYNRGLAAIRTLFPKAIDWNGSMLTQGRDIRTRSGGNISIFAPGGGLTMANSTIGNPLTPPGIVTESGGNISVFADNSVDIGIGRIFTLKGGDVTIWSSKGDIAAGSSSRTVSAAPPTRVIIDPQSASVETDLAGLATGGGIGVLATVKGVEPGNVDLIAPRGAIDAGDAGISASGNINLAAVTIVNAQNISSGGASTGTPVSTAGGPSVSAVTSASNASAAATEAATQQSTQPQSAPPPVVEETLSIISVEVISYGGGGAGEDDEDEDGKAVP